jgi:CRISPR-associated protein Cas2
MDNNLMDQMAEKIGTIIDADEDSVRIYALCAGCVSSIEILGQGEVSEDKDVYIL